MKRYKIGYFLHAHTQTVHNFYGIYRKKYMFCNSTNKLHACFYSLCDLNPSVSVKPPSQSKHAEENGEQMRRAAAPKLD